MNGMQGETTKGETVLDLEKIFTEKQIKEWKDTLVSWEEEGQIRDVNNYRE